MGFTGRIRWSRASVRMIPTPIHEDDFSGSAHAPRVLTGAPSPRSVRVTDHSMVVTPHARRGRRGLVAKRPVPLPVPSSVRSTRGARAPQGNRIVPANVRCIAGGIVICPGDQPPQRVMRMRSRSSSRRFGDTGTAVPSSWAKRDTLYSSRSQRNSSRRIRASGMAGVLAVIWRQAS